MSGSHLRSTLVAASVLALLFGSRSTLAQPPTLTDPKLELRPVIEGLTLPISMAFIGRNDLLVLEKNTGRVRRVTRGVDRGVVLDLAVNFGSERGLLGVAVHPDFEDNRNVYLFWTCRTSTTPPDLTVPTETECPGPPALGEDTGLLPQVPLLGNRVDRFRWTGSRLVWRENLITLRAFQADSAPTPPGQGDEAQPTRGNHNGGVLRFGPDGKLYVLFGDQGRRGQLQNLPSGPTETGLGPLVPDDQFGGPQPDAAHLAGVILRLDPDGDTPRDNPFYSAGKRLGGAQGRNLQRIFAYGIRNSFGMAFDPESGDLWAQENGEDAFDEINRVEAGFNSGWIQVMGPLSRIAEYRQIELTSTHGGDTPGPNLQQLRWGPERIALTPEEARSRFFEIRGSHYSDPEFSWKHVIAPAGIGFVKGRGLGRKYEGDLIVGLSVPFPEDGALLRFDLTENRRRIAVDDPRLADRVADNVDFNDLTESESLLIGRGFGVVTDIQTGPDGHLYVVSLSNGAIYEISGPDRRGKRDRDDDDDDDDSARPVVSEGSDRPTAANVLATSLLVQQPRAGVGRMIRFTLDAPQRARITIHDVAGRLVSRVVDSEVPAGEHQMAWPSGLKRHGVYFVRLEAIAVGKRTIRTAKIVVID